jgi:hypothetical protein
MPIRTHAGVIRRLATGATTLTVVLGISWAFSVSTSASSIGVVRLMAMNTNTTCVWPSWGVSSSNHPPTQFTVGEHLSYQFVAPKGPAGGTWDLEDSTLPPEFTLTASGLLSGTAQTVGTFHFGVDYVGPGGSSPRDGFCGYNDEQLGYTLTVSPSTPVPVGAVGGIGLAAAAGAGFVLLQRRRRETVASR